MNKGNNRESGLLSFKITEIAYHLPDNILNNEELTEAGLKLEDIDYFVFHQANFFMLENIREIIGIPKEKMIYEFEEVGNTVSASIPIALKKACGKGKISAGKRLMLVGFGLGYSWGGNNINVGIKIS